MTTPSTWRYADEYEYVARVPRGLGPVMITCAVNGGLQGKETHAAIPETPDEIAEQCAEAYDAGAAIVHIHARDADDPAAAARDAEVYAEITALVRARCPGLIVNHTTGGGLSTTMEERLRCLDARPDMASLNLGPDMSRFRLPPRPAPLDGAHDGGELDVCIPYTYGIVEGIATRMKELGIKAELEMLHPGQYWVSRSLIEQELIEAPYVFQYVMGYQTSSFATPQSLCDLVRQLPGASLFFALGVGPFQLPMTTLALVMGGHVRVGLEDNVYYSRGRKLRGNGEAVERAVRIATELQRPVATPSEARAMLGLPAITAAPASTQ